jgi:hypothetical protein
MNKKVALTGKLVENPFNAASLVMFTGITEVK